MTPQDFWDAEVARAGSVLLADPVAAISKAAIEEREACAKELERIKRHYKHGLSFDSMISMIRNRT